MGFIVAFFASWMAVDAVAGLVLGESAGAFLDRSDVFAVTLTLTFAVGGAAIGAAQWLHVRQRVARAAGWIVGMALAFAVAGLTYVAIVELVGIETMNRFWPRLANEIGHNLLGGVVGGYVMWRLVLRDRGVAAGAWVPSMAAAMVAAGLVAWIAESALSLPSGDAAPLGILAVGLITAWKWQRLKLEAMPPAQGHAEGVEPLGDVA